MLKQRKKVQILIYPKVFNVLSFYSKGHYTVHISVAQESIDGKITYARPQIIQSKTHKIHQSKKAYLNTQKQKNQFAFVTEQFFITYNQQCVALHTMAAFSLQYDPQASAKIYIDFKLNLNRFKVQQNPGGMSSGVNSASATIELDVSQSGQLSPRKTNGNNNVIKKRVLHQVDKRRIYINNIMELDEYKRIIFSQCEYFSFLDVSIISCYLGTRFRLHDYQLSQFHCLEDKAKIQHFYIAQQTRKKLIQNDQGALLIKQLGCSAQQFRVKFNSQLASSYVNLRRKMQKLIKIYQQNNYLTQQIQQYKKIIQNEVYLQTVHKSKQQLQKYYKTQVLQQLFLQIYRQMVQFDTYLTYLWRVYGQLIHKMPLKQFIIMIKNDLFKQNGQKQQSMIINTKIDSDLRKSEHTTFLKRRKQVLNNFKIFQDQDVYHPFIMVENYQNIELQIQPNYIQQIDTLVVFIHGYQGSDYDLQKAKNFLTVYNARCYGLLIKSIQDEIDQNLEHLGEKVAQQIKTHISGTIHNYKKISFLGYSLGGVIARQSIKHLAQFKDKMNLMVTFASPHLGVTLTDNKLVQTGIWYLINFEKVKNLKQLNCQKIDTEESQTTLNKLSDCQCLSWFKKLVVVSSEQDNFVPYHSSRISENIKNQDINTMSKNILSRVKKIQRVEVWFDVDHDIKTFDKILGRRAHIQFLQNRIFLDLFFRLYGKQF